MGRSEVRNITEKERKYVKSIVFRDIDTISGYPDAVKCTLSTSLGLSGNGDMY